jgi:hypothetical protein
VIFFIQSKPKTESDPNQFTNQSDLPFGPKMVYLPSGGYDIGSNDGEDDENRFIQLLFRVFICLNTKPI